jgi:uncharacterized membrane protein YfcA
MKPSRQQEQEVRNVMFGIVALIGVLLIAAGLSQIYEPLTYLWIGGCLLAVAWYGLFKHELSHPVVRQPDDRTIPPD